MHPVVCRWQFCFGQTQLRWGGERPSPPSAVGPRPPRVHALTSLTPAACRAVLNLRSLEQFPRTTIVHAYLLGHKDFVSALAVVPGNGGVFLLSGGGDGMVGLWDAEAGKE